MLLSYLFEHIRQKSIEAFLQYSVLVPALYYLKGNKIVAMTPLLFGEHEKEGEHQEILKKARSVGVDGFIEASESWYVTYEDNEPLIAPSKHPERRECVFMIGRQLGPSGLETEVRIYKIVRAGKHVDLVREHKAEPKDTKTVGTWFDCYF